MPTFRVGLAMAGAVSAGAYSAGVFDFLTEALHEWYQAKQRGVPGLPSHDVAISVISGASAGAVVGALGAIAWADGIKPMQADQAAAIPGESNGRRCVLPLLYATWVERPRMTPKNAGDVALLTTEDLQAGAGPRSHLISALNSLLLDQIRDAAIQPRPATAKPQRQAFVADKLNLFLRLGNLHGVPYDIWFQSVDAQGKPTPATHSMLLHGDSAHFRLDNVGAANIGESPWAKEANPIRMDIATLFDGASAPTADWRRYGQAAVASAAFPGGLSARGLAVDPKTYEKRVWPMPMDENTQIKPGAGWRADAPAYKFLSIDGGSIDNEPFEYAHWALMADPFGASANQREGDLADRAVIMVDPFPDGPAFQFDLEESPALRAILGRILGFYVDQARFKPVELAAAVSDAVFSRFLIAPRRNSNGERFDGQAAIACGALSGFGGFLDQAFRAHDYQLGRRNCQNFLRHAFALPTTNQPIVGGNDRARALNGELLTQDADDFPYVPVIPLVGEAAKEVPAPIWPAIGQTQIAELRIHVRSRADAVVAQALRETVKSCLVRWPLRLLWCVYGRRKLVNKLMAVILADLIEREQYDGPAPGPIA